MTAREVIKVLIKRKKISQDELARLCGMKGQTNVASALNRSSNMRIDTLEQLANALGYEVVLRPKESDGEEFVVHGAPTPSSDHN